MLGGIEAGGTKFVCGVGTGPDDLHVEQFQTATPEITLAEVVSFFQRNGGDDLQAIGVGSFGPVDLDLSSPTYGHITTTPKPGWAHFDLAGTIARELNVPVGFDTDVNVALMGEARWGAAEGLSDFIYLTVGTGIGGGAMVHGQVVHGLIHPEIGHLRVPHDLTADPFAGVCSYHGDCLEGLACGPAIQKRWNAPAATLPEGHPAWALEAHYLALALMNLTLTLSPQRILLGGGVMQQPQIFALLRAEFAKLLNGYLQHPDIEDLDQFIQPPGLGSRAGILGSLVLAEIEHVTWEREGHR